MKRKRLRNSSWNTSSIKKTDFITLTEMWRDCNFQQVADCIHKEAWDPSRLAEFIVYFRKYLGEEQARVLYKLL